MKGRYRGPESQKEIYSLFEQSENEGAFIWENIGDQRIIHQIESLNLNRQSETLYLNLLQEFEYRGAESLYIYHPFRKTVSKTRYLAHFGSQLSLQLPQDIRTLDTRILPRFKFKPKDEKYVILKFDTMVTSQPKQELKFKLIDISQSGLAICVSSQNRMLLQKAKGMTLTHLGKIPLPKPLHLNNVYLRPFTYRSRGKRVDTNRAGLEIEGTLKKFVLSAFADQK